MSHLGTQYNGCINKYTQAMINLSANANCICESTLWPLINDCSVIHSNLMHIENINCFCPSFGSSKQPFLVQIWPWNTVPDLDYGWIRHPYTIMVKGPTWAINLKHIALYRHTYMKAEGTLSTLVMHGLISDLILLNMLSKKCARLFMTVLIVHLHPAPWFQKIVEFQKFNTKHKMKIC